MTGTATGGEVEFRSIYGVEVIRYPLRLASMRQTLSARFFTTAEGKWKAIADEISARHATGQPILVGTTSIASSERLAELLRSRGIPFELLNGKQDKAEADVIAQAGQLGAVTIATNLPGAETDIKPSPRGPRARRPACNLHRAIRVTSRRSPVDRSRSPPGTAWFGSDVRAADDELLAQHGPALAHRIHKHASHGNRPSISPAKLRQLQTETERQATRMRQDLLGTRSETRHDSREIPGRTSMTIRHHLSLSAALAASLWAGSLTATEIEGFTEPYRDLEVAASILASWPASRSRKGIAFKRTRYSAA